METNKIADAWPAFLGQLSECLSGAGFTGAGSQLLSSEAGMELWHDLAAKTRSNGGCLYLIGNGASSSMSSHFAADLNKNAAMRTQVFTDAALITAVANDISYERVFAEPLARMAEARDMLLAISSSGKSPNILEAVSVARSKGMQIVTLSGMSPLNPLRSLGNLNIFVPAGTYGLVETAHAALLHCWTDMMVTSAKTGRT